MKTKSHFHVLMDSLTNLHEVCWIGDSITEQGKLGTGFTTYIESKFPAAEYVNLGVGGYTTKNIITIKQAILDESADVHIIAIGLNDARYFDVRGATSCADYITNMGTITSGLSNVVIISIFPSFHSDAFCTSGYEATDERYVFWNCALAKYARENDFIFINCFTLLRSYVHEYNVDELYSDGVHPSNDACKELVADSILYNDLVKGAYACEYDLNGDRV